MNATQVAGFVEALCFGLVLGGCATASARQDGPTTGGTLARDCAGVSIGLLRAGLIGLPLSFEISGVCLPRARAGGMHAIAPSIASESSAFRDAGPTALRKLTDAERSVFPKPWAPGCAYEC